MDAFNTLTAALILDQVDNGVACLYGLQSTLIYTYKISVVLFVIIMKSVTYNKSRTPSVGFYSYTVCGVRPKYLCAKNNIDCPFNALYAYTTILYCTTFITGSQCSEFKTGCNFYLHCRCVTSVHGDHTIYYTYINIISTLSILPY